MKRIVMGILSLVCFVTIAACGGGGGGSSTTPPNNGQQTGSVQIKGGTNQNH